MVQKKSSIRRSRDSDLKSIRIWLKDEELKNVHGNFFCNWPLIERAHVDRKLLVYFDASIGIPVAYQLGGLLTPGILQVKEEFRGKGIGRKLVEHLIKKAQLKDEDILRIECMPSTSIPFWKSMGFKISSDGVNAYRILDRKISPPDERQKIDLKIQFYPECVKWKDNIKPLELFDIPAYVSGDGTAWLKNRLLFYPHQYNEIGDPVIKIMRSEKILYCDKLKYREARKRGVQRCRNGWYIDFVTQN